jgi:hypothetical protein
MIKEGDIIDIDRSHVAKGSRVLARVKTIMPNISDHTILPAVVSWIKCNKKPYLCDTVYDDLINLLKAKLADPKVLKKLKIS